MEVPRSHQFLIGIFQNQDINGGTPSHHPFLDWDFPEKNHVGIPMTMETPICMDTIVVIGMIVVIVMIMMGMIVIFFFCDDGYDTLGYV